MTVITTTPKTTLQVILRMWENWNPYALLVGIENCAATMESSMEASHETQHKLEPSMILLFSFHTVIRKNKKSYQRAICPPAFMQCLFCLPWLLPPVANIVNPTPCMANGAKFEKIENYNSRYQEDTPLPKKVQPPFFREEWDS